MKMQKQSKEKELFDLVKRIGWWHEGDLHIDLFHRSKNSEQYIVYQKKGYCFNINADLDESGEWDYWFVPEWRIKNDGSDASVQKAIDLVKRGKFLEQDLQGNIIDKITGLKKVDLTADLQGNIIKKKLKAPLKKAEKNITQKLHKAGKK